MIGQPRTPGRHRAGQTPASAPVHRRVWDGPARSEADRLARSHPQWLVLYGTGSRKFYAIACWPAPQALIVDAATAGELEKQMDQAETEALLHAPPGPASPEQARRRPPLPGARRRAVRPLRGLPYPPEGSAA